MQMPSTLQQAAFHTFIYIGAGHCEDFSDYAALPVKQFLLVEPNPDCMMSLRRIAKEDTRVSILPCAVSGEKTPADLGTLHIWNNAAFNGLYTTAALHTLLPGLRAIAALEVPLRGIDTLLDTSVVSGDGCNILKLEALGENTAILQRLADLSLLDRFERILLTIPQDPIYGQDETAQAALHLVETAGFEQSETSDLGLGLVSYHFQRNALLADYQDMKRRLNKGVAERDAAQADLEKMAQRAAAAEAESTQRAAALQEAVAKLEAVQANEAAQAKDIKALKDKVAARQDTIAGLQADLDARVTQVQGARKTVAKKEETITALQDKLDQKDSELSIALRTQAAMQLDLAHMRDRYATLHAEKSEADALLFQVTERLNTASEYLHQLSKPVEVSADEEPGQVRKPQAASVRKSAPGGKRESGA